MKEGRRRREPLSHHCRLLWASRPPGGEVLAAGFGHHDGVFVTDSQLAIGIRRTPPRKRARTRVTRERRSEETGGASGLAAVSAQTHGETDAQVIRRAVVETQAALD